MQSPFVITIDGPAGAGKSTMARRLAEALSVRYLDTGALYRAITHRVLARGVDPNDEAKVLECIAGETIAQEATGVTRLGRESLREELRRPAIDAAVSAIAAHPRVRAWLVPVQRGFAAHASLVCEGRDTGTVIFPDAELKIWLDADPTERAQRRLLDRGGRPQRLAEEEAALVRRDEKDANRTTAPLVRADDQIVVDTTGKSIDEVLAILLGLVRTRSPDRSVGDSMA